MKYCGKIKTDEQIDRFRNENQDNCIEGMHDLIYHVDVIAIRGLKMAKK